MPENNGRRIERATQTLMEGVHKDFLLKMHERFGISNLPRRVKIQIQRVEESGLMDFRYCDNIRMFLDPNGNNASLPDDISIGGTWLRIPNNSGLEGLWLEKYYPFWFYDRVYTCAHESAHYLHYIVNPGFYSDSATTDKKLPSIKGFSFHFRRDAVVTVGTLDYFKIYGDLQKIYRYVKPTVFEEEIWESYKNRKFKLKDLVKLSHEDLVRKNIFYKN